MLSIIIINKNRDSQLPYCIKSILSQICEEDELIIVDDASTDKSMDIINENFDSFSHIIQIESNGNRSRVRNEAAKFAKNDILVYVDSDVMIGPENLSIVRKLHRSNPNIIATTGNVAGNGLDENQFLICTGKSVSDFANHLEKNFNYIYKYERLFDERYFDKLDKECAKHNWRYFYSSFISIDKKNFFRVGGFDEKINGWGAEDIDLGYRLNILGDIFFCNEIISFHLPHEKNIFINSYENINNIYYMLNKYQSIDIEVYCSFVTSNFIDTLDSVKKICMDVCNFTNSKETITKLRCNELMIHLPCDEFCYGKITYRLTNKCQIIPLLGIAMPFYNSTFQIAYIDFKWIILPDNILCMIIQESLRVAKKVRLIYKQKKYVQKISGENLYNSFPLYDGCFYSSQYIMDFDFEIYENFIEVKWKNNANIYLEKQIYNKTEKRKEAENE